MMDQDLKHDMLSAAKKCVDENLRHSHDSLFMLLSEWFPEAEDDEISEIVESVL